MTLLDLQRRFASVVMQPLTRREGMRTDLRSEAEALIRPNDRLTSFERLEIYNRQYWFRILGSFAEDFPGLRTVLGKRRFDTLARAYLAACPSISFTLRNLGSRFERWLQDNLRFIAGCEALALDVVRLEWAHIEAFDEAALPAFTLSGLEGDLAFGLQPYLRFLALNYPVDELLVNLRTTPAQRRKQPPPESLHLAVHRLDNSMYYKRISAEEFRLLTALAAGDPLDDAIEKAFATSSLSESERIADLQAAFANWAELGWFCQVRVSQPL